MTPDVLDRLRRRDPAADLQPPPPDDLLARLIAEPRPAAAPRRSPLADRRVRIAVGVAAAAALAGGVSVAGLGGASPDLAARAYAQTDPARGVLHVFLRDRTEFDGPQKPPDTDGTVESWVHGDEAHTILRGENGTLTSDQLLGADGVIRNVTDTGELQTLSPDDGAEAREIIARSRQDFVSDFRSRYERGVLDDTGDTTFMGRAARRYVVTHPGVHVAGGDRRVGASTEEYFVDPSNGAPLGSIFSSALYVPHTGKDGKAVLGKDGHPVLDDEPSGTVRFIQAVEKIERLPATPANLAKVRER
jgi:hypothetical protein